MIQLALFTEMSYLNTWVYEEDAVVTFLEPARRNVSSSWSVGLEKLENKNSHHNFMIFLSYLVKKQ